MSVFVGGCTLEAAEAVGAGDGITTDEVLNLIASLNDKSLVLVEHTAGNPARYRLLETLRQYGHDRLIEHDAAEPAAHRHAAYFTELGERAQANFFGPNEAQALNGLEIEFDNLRAALAWLIQVGDAQQAARLGAVVGLFCFFRSHLSEGRGWLERALSMDAGRQPSTARAQCLFAAAHLAWGQGNYEAARAHVQESLGIWRKLGTRWRERGDGRKAATALYMLGFYTRILGNTKAAVPLLQEAVQVGHEAANHPYEVLSLVLLADIAASQSEFTTARSYAERAHEVADQSLR